MENLEFNFNEGKEYCDITEQRIKEKVGCLN